MSSMKFFQKNLCRKLVFEISGQFQDFRCSFSMVAERWNVKQISTNSKSIKKGVLRMLDVRIFCNINDNMTQEIYNHDSPIAIDSMNGVSLKINPEDHFIMYIDLGDCEISMFSPELSFSKIKSYMVCLAGNPVELVENWLRLKKRCNLKLTESKILDPYVSGGSCS